MGKRICTLLLATTSAVALGSTALANPLGGQVVGGNATVQGQGTSTVTVTQTTNSAIVNWTTFNIGAGERTNIIMPNSSSVQLDRVTGGQGPSQILGTLTSNGRVFLVNPDGLLFGPGSVVNAAGFLATTHDITNADFMAGRYNFSIPGRPTASIVNQGTITAQTGGFAALVAPGVRNSGTITATLGKVALASGNSFTLDFYGDKLITLDVNDTIAAQVKDVATGLPLDALVKNTGTLKADGGRVELTAVAARQVVDAVINNTGIIEADTIGTQNGLIVLGAATAASKPTGAPAQTVKVSGTLSASGKQAGGKGGTIQVTGESIALSAATLSASGRAGGGKVLVGGDRGGANAAVPNASTVSIDAASTIDASAKDNGDGGKVVVWSNQNTIFNGTIMASAGSLGGDGGFVETSGGTLGFAGARVDTSAPKGRTGSWLLDPFDLTIDLAAANAISLNLASTNVTVETTASGFSGPGIPNPVGNGDIFVNANISWASNNSLTLSAYRNLVINSNISNSGSGNIIGRSDNTGTGFGTIAGLTGTSISTGGTVTAYYNPSVNPAGSGVNSTSYVNPSEPSFYAGHVNAAGGFTAYMLVNTVSDLQNIQNNLSGTYALGRNIDARVTSTWNGNTGFVPINVFNGTLEGLGHNIEHLTIAPTLSTTSQIGLFGTIAPGGIVANLNLTDVDIRANPNSGTNFQSIGALAGTNLGFIDNVFASGTINGGAISGVTAGGLVGFNFASSGTLGAINNSRAAVAVTLGDGTGCSSMSTSCSSNTAGGLTGQNFGSIANSSASGNIVVGANAQAGGLVGQNFSLSAIPGSPPGTKASTITNSFATGNVSSAGVNVGLGGLVGYNSSGAVITTSYATGAVTATAALTANIGLDCSTTNACQYVSAGGLVGQNSGTIQGTPVLTAVPPCGAGQTCATGAVSVGSGATGGGLVGWNEGIISNAFANGAVTGAAGLTAIGTNHEHTTNLGGLVGSNQGLIAGSHATGNVGTANVANLSVGGLVSDNGGAIMNSYATGNVRAGNNSQAGGLTANNGQWDSFSCSGCIAGDGSAYFNAALIDNSHASGNVTVGAGSLAGGLSGSGDRRSIFSNSSATGAVTGGGNSILGGFVGVTDIGAYITNSTASGAVASTGANSWVGGFTGLNGGTIQDSHASGETTGTSDSLVGGFAGLNLGSIIDSTTAANTIVTANNNYIGGFVGANFGSIDPSTASGSVTAGANNIIGGFAGTNASLSSSATIPGSTFPNGTISSDSVSTGLVNGTTGAQVGTTTPAGLPTAPSIVASCNNGTLCSILQGGLTLATGSPGGTTVLPSPVPQITQTTVPAESPTPPPVLASLTTPPPASPPPGSSTAPTPGKSGYVPPPLPGRPVAGPHGETRSSIPPPGENRFFPNQVLLQLELNVPEAELTRIVQGLGLRIITTDTLNALDRRVIRLELPAGMSVRDAIRRLEANRLVSVAAPVYQFRLVQVTGSVSKGDPSQYILGNLNLSKAHEIASGKGITVAVIDSEVDKQHAELRGAVSEEFDTLAAQEAPHSHGTAMVGAIVSRGQLLGVAPNANILAVRAFGKSNNTAEGTTLSILKGIDWAVNHGARIINMSFAGPRDPALERALKAAHDKGVVLIAAAGMPVRSRRRFIRAPIRT